MCTFHRIHRIPCQILGGNWWETMNPLILKANQVSPAEGSGECGGWDAPTHFPCLFLITGYSPHKPHRAQGTPASPELRIHWPLNCLLHYLHVSLLFPKWSPQCSEDIARLHSFLVRCIQSMPHYPTASGAGACASGSMPLHVWLQPWPLLVALAKYGSWSQFKAIVRT